ncbi:MAG: hypothetical protein GEU78_15910, partial [Actinobacteria bacterium]|nr:hypothetical protein [Actinomycetota bacterium]
MGALGAVLVLLGGLVLAAPPAVGGNASSDWPSQQGVGGFVLDRFHLLVTLDAPASSSYHVEAVETKTGESVRLGVLKPKHQRGLFTVPRQLLASDGSVRLTISSKGGQRAAGWAYLLPIRDDGSAPPTDTSTLRSHALSYARVAATSVTLGLTSHNVKPHFDDSGRLDQFRLDGESLVGVSGVASAPGGLELRGHHSENGTETFEFSHQGKNPLTLTVQRMGDR